MKILSIETSCDDTSIAVVRAEGGFKRPCFNILSKIFNVIQFLSSRGNFI